MTREELDYFEKLLKEERHRLMAELGDLGEGMNRTARESSGDLSAYSLHMADQATDSMEREKSFYLASLEGQALEDIDYALGRIASGEYGNCANCGREILRERLEVLPGARHCIACQEEVERQRRNGASEA